jgi:hypothetical protein
MKSSELENTTWEELKRLIMDATEEECAQMLVQETAGLKRTEYLRRIHGRMNKLRIERERGEYK